MRNVDGSLRLSASDLMRFKGCRHATTLDLRYMETGDIVPAADGEEALLLQKQGTRTNWPSLTACGSQAGP